MSGMVWLPESSLAHDEGVDSQVEKEKRKKPKIVKRTAPTVELRSTQAAPSRLPGGKQSYGTIERSRYSKNALHLNLNAPSEPCKNAAEFCGWETDRGPRNALASSCTSRRCVAVDRTSLNTPADGYRSTLQSRACSRASGNKRRDVYYEFRHFADIRDHLEDYCVHCSFSGLCLSRESVDAIREAVGEGSNNRRKMSERVVRCVPVTRQHGEGSQPFLEQLASRLGVRESLMNEKQLRYGSQPTPPSFTKKSRVAADLLVTTQDEKTVTIIPQENTDCVCPTEEQSTHDPEVPSRAISARQNTPTAVGPLPKIIAQLKSAENKKTLSTTSVNKYLTISSGTHRTTISLGLGEEESAVDVSSPGSPGEAVPSKGDVLLEKVESSKRQGRDVYSTSVNNASRACQPPKFDEDAWRDRVLSQKARALGLLSRDWAQAPQLKRVMNDETMGSGTTRPGTRADTNKPHTRTDTRPRTRANSRRDTRPHTRMDTTSYRQQNPYLYHSRRKEPSTESRPRTSHEKVTSARTSEKLEKMRAIYEPGGCKRSSNRDQQATTKHRCHSQLSERPVAEDQAEKPNYVSRPGTKLRKRMHIHRPVLESEESQYWNEVPHTVCPHSQFHTGNGTNLTAVCHSDDRPPQSVKIYGNNTKEFRLPRQPAAPKAFELGGHHYRRYRDRSVGMTFSHKTRKRGLDINHIV